MSIVDTVAGARRRRLRRGIVILPSAFTLGNLFLGVWVNAQKVATQPPAEGEGSPWKLALAVPACSMLKRASRRMAAVM